MINSNRARTVLTQQCASYRTRHGCKTSLPQDTRAACDTDLGVVRHNPLLLPSLSQRQYIPTSLSVLYSQISTCAIPFLLHASGCTFSFNQALICYKNSC